MQSSQMGSKGHIHMHMRTHTETDRRGSASTVQSSKFDSKGAYAAHTDIPERVRFYNAI